MSDIDINNRLQQLGLGQVQETAAKAKAGNDLGQTEFLELMTAQLKYQDPLKPMENGDFLAQMAQFSTVSGIKQLNDNFNSLSTSFQSNQALQASTLVGRKVLVPSHLGLLTEGGSFSGSVDLTGGVQQLVITVNNQAGQVVNRQILGPQAAGLVDFEWKGTDETGRQMPAGEYRVEAELRRGADWSAGDVLMVANVESVTLGKAGQALELSTKGMGDFSINAVREIL